MPSVASPQVPSRIDAEPARTALAGEARAARITSDGAPAVTIYTDGGADPNPGVGGWGAVVIHDAAGEIVELSGGEDHTTNNRMELTAAIRALESLDGPYRVVLYTDSKYLQKGVTAWLSGWIARGWTRKTGGEILNLDLWRRLATLRDEQAITWRWVKGHAGNRYNERADALATAEIQRRRGGAPATLAAAVAAAAPVDVDLYLRVSCSGTRGVWAAMVASDDGQEVQAAAVSGTTSNRLDLIAAIAGLEATPAGVSVAVHTASDYLRNGASDWIRGWKQRGWLTKEGKPVASADLWRRLDDLAAERTVTWPSVKGREVPAMENLRRVLDEELANSRR